MRREEMHGAGDAMSSAVVDHSAKLLPALWNVCLVETGGDMTLSRPGRVPGFVCSHSQPGTAGHAPSA